jgi:hypothetical protein
MKTKIAEQLLGKVMGWGNPELAAERPLLQALAEFKYDEYQQFSAGDRFLENLIRWLAQLRVEDRHVAYDFVKANLIFFSASELDHLVAIAYPHVIRPHLLRQTALELGRSQFAVCDLGNHMQFQDRQNRTLFVALSDGSRIDRFRRANPNLDHEQIVQSYEFGGEKCEGLLEKLRKRVNDQSARFTTIVLLDDFSASGTSYFAHDGVKGKLAKFFRALLDTKSPIGLLVPEEASTLQAIVVIYVATTTAEDHIRKGLHSHLGIAGVSWQLKILQTIPEAVRLLRGCPSKTQFQELVEKRYYDPTIFDSHMQKGGSIDGRYGYADGGIPVILHHNTPNNSVALLWSYADSSTRGLFPRVRRHKDQS